MMIADGIFFCTEFDCTADDFGAVAGVCPIRPFSLATCCVCDEYNWQPVVYSTDEEQKYLNLGCFNSGELAETENRLSIAAQESRLFCYFEEDDANLANFFPNDDPCLQYLYSDSDLICTLCKFGAIRFFFIYDEKTYVACGKYFSTTASGIDLCVLSDYYNDVWPDIYASNPIGAINDLYRNNTDGE